MAKPRAGMVVRFGLLAASLAGVVPAVDAGASAQPPAATTAADLSAYVGRWTIDPTRTHMGRNGPAGKDILRSTTFTFAFRPEGAGLRMDVYAEYPQAQPTRSMALVADGRNHVCAGPAPCLTNGGSASEQSFTWNAIDPHMLTRILYVKGAVYDYSTLSVSTDGQTMTLLSWAPATPQYMNLQVFTKQP